MTELEKLGLEQIGILSKELEDGIIHLAVIDKEELNRDKHIYPLVRKAADISRWVSAIEENIEKTEEE